MIGQTISHYKIIEKLGGGGMGIVYKAHDLNLDRVIALKFLPPTFSLDEETKQRFINEAKAASSLQHQNICTIHEIDETEDGQLFICMDCYDGETLKSKVANGTLESIEVIKIMLQIADGLNKTHSKGIIHRDIKPANIFISNEGIVKILDFGLASSSSRNEFTQIDNSSGTCNCMSPEQVLGEEADHRADIWALGIVMFEMLTGKPPFDSKYNEAIIYSILNVELEKINTRLPESLNQIIFKCLQKDLNDRYQHIEELISDLLEVKKECSITYSAIQPKLPSFLNNGSRGFSIDKTVLVAREQELEKLERFLDSALSGRSQLVFVTGESGAGKTALVEKFTNHAQKLNNDLIVINGKCNAHTGFGDPYFPFIELLNLLTGDIESKFKAGVISREHALRLWKLTPLTIRAILEHGTDLINIFTQGNSLVSRVSEYFTKNLDWLVQLKKLVKEKASLPVDLTIQQRNIFEQYTRVIKSIAEEKPLLIVLDDLQWIDAGSASLLFHITRQIKGSRIIIIGIFRKTEIAIERDGKRHPIESFFNEVKRDYGEIEIDLDKLPGQKFVDAYLDAEPNKLSDKFRRTFFIQTKGHPLFTVELFSEMKEHGIIIRDTAGRWTEGKTFEWNRLPTRVDAVINERINRLTEKMRNILKIASIEGEEFTAEVVNRLLNIDERELIRILSSELEKRHQLVSAKGVKSLIKQRISLYAFRHIMFQKYLYNTLDVVERVHLHEQVGKIIEELYGEKTDEVSVQLARHFQEAGIPAKAFEYLVKAGTRAVHFSAYEETILLFNKALDILKTFPESTERDQQELNLQMAITAASQSLKGFGAPEIITYCNRIEELCKKIGEAPPTFNAHYFLAQFHWLRADHKIAFNFTEKMMQHAKKVNDVEKVALSHFMQGMLYFYLGNLTQAIENLKKMNSYYIFEKCSRLKYIYGMDPGLISGMNTACVLWALGYPDQALLRCQKMLPQVRLINHSFSSVTSLAFNSLLHIFRKDSKALEPLGKEIYSVSANKGFALFIGVGLFKTGFAFVHQGQVKEGINKLLQALEIYKATGIRFTLSDLLGSISEAYGMSGDVEKGMDFMEQALTEVQRGNEHYYEAELYRIKGELILKKVDDKNRKELEKEAEECFKKSLKVAQEQMAKSFELRTSLSLFRLLEKQDKKEEARQLLTKIYNWFTEGFEEPDLRESKAMLEDLKSGKEFTMIHNE